jgi:hypothetical protein
LLGVEQVVNGSGDLVKVTDVTRIFLQEVWVKGAHRFRNPDEDLPQDFDTQRGEYYAALEGLCGLTTPKGKICTLVRQEISKELKVKVLNSEEIGVPLSLEG